MTGSDMVNGSRRRLLAAAGAVLLAAAVRPFGASAQGVAQGAAAQGGTADGGKAPIGVIGAGHIGGTVGGLWVKAGHPVMFSSRHPEELKDLVAGLGPLAHAGTVEQAVAYGNAVFLAVPYGALPELGQTYGAALRGKLVLDAGNAVATRDGAIAEEAESDGIGATSQKYLPGTKLVRAFNTLPYRTLQEQANRDGAKLAIPIAGDDAEAVKQAAALVRDAGFDPVVVGNLAAAKLFQRGGPGYGQAVTAAELRQRLSLAQ